MARLLKPKRAKTKGKRVGKREQAQILALSQLGQGTYVIGHSIGRAPNTVKKYIASPLFHDKKFEQMVEEYKTKEILDLTVLSIESRARLHDLVPTMTPIEAIALMDKSFQQGRLLSGKSTENIFSLRRIIEEAHTTINVTVDKISGHSKPAIDVSPPQEYTDMRGGKHATLHEAMERDEEIKYEAEASQTRES